MQHVKPEFGLRCCVPRKTHELLTAYVIDLGVDVNCLALLLGICIRNVQLVITLIAIAVA